MPLAAHEAEASIAVLPGMSDPKLRGAPLRWLGLRGSGRRSTALDPDAGGHSLLAMPRTTQDAVVSGDLA